jgi:nucleotide-binding universal stress UspA family protein
MNSLIIPVNFSDCSSNAARYAADLAKTIQGEIHLIHVIATDTSAELMMTGPMYQEMLEAAETYMQQLQQELTRRTAGAVPVHTSVVIGSVIGQVEVLCDRLHPYAVVLGVTGPTLTKTITGSPVSALLHLAYPVLVLPENAVFHQFQRIALACDVHDLESGLPHSLPLLKTLRQQFHARIDIITIEDWKTWTGEEYFLRSQVWKRRLGELEPEIHQVHTSQVAEGIADYLVEHPADLVIVFPKKHNILELHTSQSRKFARHSSVPVLSLHE